MMFATIGRLSVTRLSLLQANAIKIDMYSVFTPSASETILTFEISFLKIPTKDETNAGFPQLFFQMLSAAIQAPDLLLVSASSSKFNPNLWGM